MKSSLVGVIIAIPTVVAFLTVWSLSNDLLYGAITGLVVNFIAMGVSFKIVKIFFIKIYFSTNAPSIIVCAAGIGFEE